MSTDYRPTDDISVADLFDGRLEQFGVREFIPPPETEAEQARGRDERLRTIMKLERLTAEEANAKLIASDACVAEHEAAFTRQLLTDGRNYLHVTSENATGLVTNLRRTAGTGAPGKILGAIAEAFDTDIWSEHDYQYWGFASREEEEAFHQGLAKQHDEELYQVTIDYLVHGQPHTYRRTTLGAIAIEHIKQLSVADPTLLEPVNKERVIHELHAAMDARSVRVTLTEAEWAAAKMAATHEDDLPQA
jgi:hypothetical protein